MANIPIRKKPPTNPNPEADDTGTAQDQPAERAPARAAERPIAGTPDQDDEDGGRVVPPPPELPRGKYVAKVSQVNRWISKETGKPAINPKTGEPSIPVVVFQIIDPAERKKAEQGKPSCFMSEDASFRMDFQGQWYDRTVKNLTAIGCGPSTWPKGKNGGQPTEKQIAEHIMETTKGKTFLITTKVEQGKGEYKDRPFVRLEKIERPPAAPAKPAPKPTPAAPVPEDDAEAAE